ncbi:MAG: hypothetical protein R3F46_15140 [bacterium]
METMRRWQRTAAVAAGLLLLLWLCGLLLLQVLRPARDRLGLHAVSRLNLQPLRTEPMADGSGGLLLQEQGGRLSHITAMGELDWQFTPPPRFELMSVQPGEGMLVLTGRWGRALAIDTTGNELWRFEPVHNEMGQRRLRMQQPEASFYSMATALVYGLDERGQLLWFLQLPSASSMQSQRPWMAVDSEGWLQSRTNGGRVRISPEGREIGARGNSMPWQLSQIELRGELVLERDGAVNISRLDGSSVGQQLGEGSPYRDDLRTYAWLTEDGFAECIDGGYARYSVDGTQLRRDDLERPVLDATAIGDEQLLLHAGPAEFGKWAALPAAFSAAMRGQEPAVVLQADPEDSSGRQGMVLESAALSIPVAIPGWLQGRLDRIHGIGSEHLLVLDDEGADRILRLGEL